MLRCALSALPVVACSTEPGAIFVTDAAFRAEGSATVEQVQVPDTWKLRGHPPADLGHYRWRFSLPAAVDEVWALEAERLSTSHEARLNGQMVDGSLRGTPPLK